MTTQRIAITSSLIIIAMIICCMIYMLLGQHSMIQDLYAKVMVEEQERHEKIQESTLIPPETLMTKHEVWRSVQEKVKDTVVQVFSQVAKIDLLQPFKTPSQHSAYGSAFFINEQGDLISNAHVVNQAKVIWIQIPSLGKQIIDVDVIGLSPERDLALLRVKPEGLALIREKLGAVPYLAFGDSDTVRRSDEVMALGYPLGQQSLKSTTGVISGREHNFIQMSAAINPGNSGGPLVNIRGEVIGVNSAGILEAQNVGYMIPINDLKQILPDLYNVKLLRKPFLGILYHNATESLTEFLGNPQPGGCYVIEVVKNSALEKAGVKPGDMLYEINGNAIDGFGEMVVPWSEDKITIMDYIARLAIGDNVHLVFYRNGRRKQITVVFKQTELPAIRKIYPGYEDIDYEIVGGMVVMPLTINHIQLMAEGVPGLTRYAELNNQSDPVLVVTHIFPNSQLSRARTIMVGATIKQVNGKTVRTLHDLRHVLAQSVDNKFLTIKVVDNISRASENMLVALPLEKVLQDEPILSRDYRYVMSDTIKTMVQAKIPHYDDNQFHVSRVMA